jgi:hypothetical protein
METDQPNSRRGPHGSVVVALIAVLAIAAGGYFYYRNAERADIGSGLQQTAAPPASDAERTTAPASPADAASNQNPQRSSAAAAAPPPNQVSPAPAAAADNAPPGPPTPQQAENAPVPSGNGSAAEPSTPQNRRTQSASLPIDDIAYVQKSSANIRSEPSLRGKRVGKAAKGTKVKVLSRAGKWVQVESGETTGWISGKLLGDQLP